MYSRTILRSIFYVLLSVSALLPSVTLAYNPHVIETPAQNDVLPLAHPEVAQTIYGNLEGYPHMFEFATTRPLPFFAEVWIPESKNARNTVSGIILRVNDNGSVKEVARLRAKDATWTPFYEPWSGDSYRRGASFREMLDPGLYRLEVSTPDNIGKYVLVVGTKGEIFGTGYFALLGELVKVKAFSGKSSWRIVESPFVYVPLALLALSLGAWYYLRRRRTPVHEPAAGELRIV